MRDEACIQHIQSISLVIFISENNFWMIFVQQFTLEWKGERTLSWSIFKILLPINDKASSKVFLWMYFQGRLYLGRLCSSYRIYILFYQFINSLLQQNRIVILKRNVMDDSEDNQLEKQAQIYKRQRLLGSGSYGRAFLVKQIATDVQWVVKQINLADLMPSQQNQAMKQAKILQLLDHPNIIRFKQVYRTKKGKLNIVMEYAENGDLALNIKKAKQTGTHFSQQTILNWFVQMCIGMKHIHERKIIHRDLKPQNIFLSADNLIKIGDFGVARVMENTIAKARTVVGSPYYLSPEIIENKPYSYKTDIWSMGTLLFQLCALEPPFKANNIQFLALKIVQGSYAQIPRQYSQGLRMLIKSMLQTKEANRPNISQILSSRIVSERMRKFIAQQQQKLNNLNIIRQPAQTMSYFNMGELKSPPNLLEMDMIQNKSQIVMSKNMINNNEQTHSPVITKAKTPQIIVRKGPNNFMHRPPSSKRKIESIDELADLIQIKPSIIQTHDKVQKPNHVLIPLPKVPKTVKIPKIHKEVINAQNKQPQKIQIKIKQAQKVELKKPSSGFSKKRVSFTNLHEKGEKKVEIKEQKLEIVNNFNNGKKQNVIRIKVEKKVQKTGQKDQQKGLCNKKNSVKSLKSPQISATLQVVSQQAKKKIVSQRKAEKKIEKPKKKPKRLIPKPIDNLIQRQQIMQQQKCNNQQQILSNNNLSSQNYDYFSQNQPNQDNDDENEIDEYYDNESFQSYQQKQKQNEEEYDFQLSLSTSNQPKEINNYHKMLSQINKINKLVNNHQGRINQLPIFGEQIPEIFNFNDEIRQDDSQLQSAKSINDPLQASEQIITPKTQELEHLRMNLEFILGVENVIFAYHTISKEIELFGLDLDEQQTILKILKGCPEMDQQGIRNYFRLIVTIITIQNKNL